MNRTSRIEQPVFQVRQICGEQFGPPTTRSLSGAGGPFNQWDNAIREAKRRRKWASVKQLRRDRAAVMLAFGVLEAVFVPTAAAAVMLGLAARAARDGVATRPAGQPIARKGAR